MRFFAWLPHRLMKNCLETQQSPALAWLMHRSTSQEVSSPGFWVAALGVVRGAWVYELSAEKSHMRTCSWMFQWTLFLAISVQEMKLFIPNLFPQIVCAPHSEVCCWDWRADLEVCPSWDFHKPSVIPRRPSLREFLRFLFTPRVIMILVIIIAMGFCEGIMSLGEGFGRFGFGLFALRLLYVEETANVLGCIVFWCLMSLDSGQRSAMLCPSCVLETCQYVTSPSGSTLLWILSLCQLQSAIWSIFLCHPVLSGRGEGPFRRMWSTTDLQRSSMIRIHSCHHNCGLLISFAKHGAWGRHTPMFVCKACLMAPQRWWGWVTFHLLSVFFPLKSPHGSSASHMTIDWFHQFSCSILRVFVKSVKYDLWLHSLLLVCNCTVRSTSNRHVFRFCLKGAVCMIISEVPFFYFADPIVQRFGIMSLGSKAGEFSGQRYEHV